MTQPQIDMFNIGDKVRFIKDGQLVRGVIKRKRRFLWWQQYLIEYGTQEDYGDPIYKTVDWIKQKDIIEVKN